MNFERAHKNVTDTKSGNNFNLPGDARGKGLFLGLNLVYQEAFKF